MASVFELVGQVPGELGGPRRGRVGGATEQVYSACVDFDDERDVEPLQCDRAVDVEEVGG